MDHVIARSWFPQGTDPIEKWKVPAYEPCNNRLSADEQTTLQRLALCMDPGNPALSKIVDNARRARDPKAGRSPRDIVRRFNFKQRVLRGVVRNPGPDHPGLLPAFRGNFSKGSTTGVLIPRKELESVVTKWIHGVHYCELGEPVPENAKVTAFFVSDEVGEEAFQEIE